MLTELDVKAWSAMERRPLASGAYDVFVDLTSLDWPAGQLAAQLERLQRYAGFGSTGARLTVAAKPAAAVANASVDGAVRWVAGIPGWHSALVQAALDHRALLVVLGPALPPNEIVVHLWDALHQDPLIGTAQPRFADGSTDALVPLPGGNETCGPARDAVPHLPASVVTAELLSACTLLRATVVEALAFSPADAHVTKVDQVAGAVLEDLVVARRCGFRNLVVNAAVVPLPPPTPGDPSALSELAYPRLDPQSQADVYERFADADKAARMNAASPARAMDLAAAGLGRDAEGRRSLLLDCRGVAPVHNGTSQCILGLLSGMAKAGDERFDIHVLSHAEGASFHGLRLRFPQFQHWHEMPSRSFAAALVPNQPWSIGTLAELHRHAWSLAVNMLDTIAWDIVYAADEAVEKAWQFVANHVDGVAFNSAHTRARFGFRFPVAVGILQRVVHHSLHADDHVLPSFVGRSNAGHVLIFGNHYDHKDVAPTVATLSDAFPEQLFALVGRADIRRPNVRALASGGASTETVHDLMASARCVVYPSFYEGFGLPLVESLAYRKTVLVRESPLWGEITAHSRLPGHVAQYRTGAELVELLGQTLAGQRLAVLPAGSALAAGEAVVDWTESARRMLAFVQACIDQATHNRWMRREQVLRMAGI